MNTRSAKGKQPDTKCHQMSANGRDVHTHQPARRAKPNLSSLRGFRASTPLALPTQARTMPASAERTRSAWAIESRRASAARSRAAAADAVLHLHTRGPDKCPPACRTS